jgi:Cu(I)/Ag(I) efflux system membrane protein CusA/SilA
MPIENRLDMELTGIKTPVGIKIQGPNLDQIEGLGARVQQILGSLPQVRSGFAERVAQGFYLNIETNRSEAARYGLTVGDVQRAITSGIGGVNIAENIEGRERYPISIRYAADFRDDLDKLRGVLIATPQNGQVPLGELAKLSFSKGPTMIRDEDGVLTGYVYFDLNTRDYGGFVDRADKLLREKLALPAGYSLRWSGEYEFELRAHERLKIIVPIVFFVIFLLLYMVFPFIDRSSRSHFPYVIRDDRRSPAAVVSRLQLQRCRLGGLHRTVWDRGRDRSRDGRLSTRISGTPARCRSGGRGR